MPGGGIKPYQVEQVIARTGCRDIHVAAWKSQRDDSTQLRPEVTFGGALYPPENRYDLTDRAVVAELAGRLGRQER
jgi:copper homeostasis protein